MGGLENKMKSENSRPGKAQKLPEGKKMVVGAIEAGGTG
jgi:hypothetical protein